LNRKTLKIVHDFTFLLQLLGYFVAKAPYTAALSLDPTGGLSSPRPPGSAPFGRFPTLPCEPFPL